MNFKLALSVFLTLGLSLASGLPAYSEDLPLTPSQVMEAVDTREDGDTLMILIDKHKNQRIRSIKSIRKDVGPDTKGILFFLSPADVRNTAYMSFDWEDHTKEDDSWLFLPALGQGSRM
ncbi:MAG: outer membrane lipoprotein-sorting protein [Desulfobacter sp.]|nr:outer membrane lipoprotein-sorting protein [Desulfobacter sp.]WDP84906.1 MAG: outer membrane lipoprotein-sorting protein [Desulfobacter sp.]